jgi:uncharacterized protein (TIGR03435 family)
MNPFHPVDFSRALFLVWTCFDFAAASALAQNGPQKSPSMATAGYSDPVGAFAFEVVSIRPGNAANTQTYVRLNGDEYRAIGFPLAQTILMAYFPWALQSKERISDAPGWVWKDKFDFVAKVGPDDLDEWRRLLQPGFGEKNQMLEAMLQAALADRCKLVVHRIPAAVPGFALVVAKHSPNLKRFNEAKPDEIVPDNAQWIPRGGRMVPILSPDDPILHFYAISTSSLAAMMSRWGAPVEDQTGLPGKYDFALTRLSNVGDISVNWDVAALGFKLKPITVQAETIVVDHIEYPSPN